MSKSIKIYQYGKLAGSISRSELAVAKPSYKPRNRAVARKRNRIGSNQYETKYHEHWKKTFVVSMAVIFSFGFLMHQVKRWMESETVIVFENEQVESVVNPPVVEASEPEETPEPTPSPKPLKKEVEQIIEEVFADLGPDVVAEAKLVARCESGMREEAINTKNRDASRDDGVFQINSIHGVNPRFLKDAYVNISVARQLYDEQGWQPWYSSNKCHELLK